MLIEYQVNGDTLFMTGNFKEFNVENQSNSLWDEQNAVASTAVCILFSSYVSWQCIDMKLIGILVVQDYLASIDSAAKAGFDVK